MTIHLGSEPKNLGPEPNRLGSEPKNIVIGRNPFLTEPIHWVFSRK